MKTCKFLCVFISENSHVSKPFLDWQDGSGGKKMFGWKPDDLRVLETDSGGGGGEKTDSDINF